MEAVGDQRRGRTGHKGKCSNLSSSLLHSSVLFPQVPLLPCPRSPLTPTLLQQVGTWLLAPLAPAQLPMSCFDARFLGFAADSLESLAGSQGAPLLNTFLTAIHFLVIGDN